MIRTHVDLFSGIGGFSIACEWAGVQTIAFSEIDPYANKVLQRHWPNVRNYGHVRDVPALPAWLLTAGVPCQPASVAGKRKGTADDRWLWPETLAVVENGSYKWLLFENPTGILSLNDGLEFERICFALEGQGYEVQPLVIPSAGIGAFHRRERVWILAHTQQERWGVLNLREDGERLPNKVGVLSNQASGWANEQPGNVSPVPANDWPQRIQTAWEEAIFWITAFQRGEDERRLEQERVRLNVPEPLIRRTGHGIPAELDERIKCLGNSITPGVAYQLIKRMIGVEVTQESI